MGFFFLLAGYFTPARSSAKATGNSLATASRASASPFSHSSSSLAHSLPRWLRRTKAKASGSSSLPLESRHHHQRTALVRAGAPHLLARLLRIARRLRIIPRPIHSHTASSSRLRAMASQRHPRRRRQSRHPPIRSHQAKTSSACSSATSRPTSSSSPSESPHGAMTGSANFNGSTPTMDHHAHRSMAAHAHQHRDRHARLPSRQSQLRRRTHLARHRLRLLGSVCCMGPHRRMVAVRARIHE